MKWFEGNPMGVFLLAICGSLVLLSLLLAIIWSRPVALDTATEAQQLGVEETMVASRPLGPLSSFQVINARPVFNDSRAPEVIEVVVEEPVAEPVTIEVTDPPAVRLTGIIITPGKKIASLTPAKAGEESIRLLEGQSLTGEYLGWQLSAVRPRSVVLQSLKGQQLRLALEVHDLKIKPPPSPAKPAQVIAARPGVGAGGNDQPLERAEQIRQRIAERREELRRQEELKEKEPLTRAQKQAKGRQDYESAIRALMNRGSDNNDNNDG